MRKTKKNLRNKSRSAKNSSSLIRRILIYAMSIILVILVCLIILEVGLRLAFPFDPMNIHPDSNRLYFTYPNLHFKPDCSHLNISGNYYSTNQYGYTTPSWFESGKNNILIIGDSYVEGICFGNDRFTDLMQTEMSSAGYNIVTSGISSYALDNEYKTYQDLISRSSNASVRYLFLVHFLNDDYDSYRNDIYGVKNGKLVDNTPAKISWPKQALMYSSKYFITPKIFYGIIVNSKFITGLAAKWHLSNQADKQSYTLIPRGEIPSFMFSSDAEHQDLRDKIYEKIELYMDAYKKTSASYNIKLVVVIIPISEEIFAEDLVRFHKKFGNDLDPSLMNDRFREVLDSKNITYIDLRSEIITQGLSSNLFYDFDTDFHMNPAGQRFIATTLENYIAKDAKK